MIGSSSIHPSHSQSISINCYPFDLYRISPLCRISMMTRSRRKESKSISTTRANMPRQGGTKRKQPSSNTLQGHLPTPQVSPRGPTSVQNANESPGEHNSIRSRPAKKMKSQSHRTPSAETEVEKSDTESSVPNDYAARPMNEHYSRYTTGDEEEEKELLYDYSHTAVLPSPGKPTNNSIRILILHGGPPESPLSCSLKILDLD